MSKQKQTKTNKNKQKQTKTNKNNCVNKTKQNTKHKTQNTNHKTKSTNRNWARRCSRCFIVSLFHEILCLKTNKNKKQKTENKNLAGSEPRSGAWKQINEFTKKQQKT